MRSALIFVLTLLLINAAAAQPFSYVYIQGDKVTPFYVKMNGVMMPRYGKNYCILSELVAGTVEIEILFQQHAFSPQKFIIQVPQNGYRGFLLHKENKNYLLYDLSQKKDLPPGGEIEHKENKQ